MCVRPRVLPREVTEATIHHGSKDLGSQTLNFPPNKGEGMLRGVSSPHGISDGLGTKAGCLSPRSSRDTGGCEAAAGIRPGSGIDSGCTWRVSLGLQLRVPRTLPTGHLQRPGSGPPLLSEISREPRVSG